MIFRWQAAYVCSRGVSAYAGEKRRMLGDCVEKRIQPFGVDLGEVLKYMNMHLFFAAGVALGVLPTLL